MSENQSPSVRKKKVRNKPTKKQQAAIAYLMENPNATVSEAMRHAGYAESTLDNPTRNFSGLPSTQSLAEQLRATVVARITPDVITNKIEKLMDAQRVISAYSGKTASSTDNDFIEVPDHPTQLKATELAMKVYNLNDDKGGNNNLFVNFGDLRNKYKKEGE